MFRVRVDKSRPSSISIHTAKKRKRGNNLIHTSRNNGDTDGWYATQIKVNQILRHSKKHRHLSNIIVKFSSAMRCDNCVFSEKKSYAPFISLKIVNRRREVTRRSTEDSCSSSGCCRKSLKVNFKDFGWNFVYYPSEYDAFYCKGNCSNISYKSNATQHKHTGLVEAVFKKNKKEISFCCAPKKFSALNMIYMHKGSLIRRAVPNMIVDECWCI